VLFAKAVARPKNTGLEGWVLTIDCTDNRNAVAVHDSLICLEKLKLASVVSSANGGELKVKGPNL